MKDASLQVEKAPVVGKIRPTQRPSAVKFQNNQGSRRSFRLPESEKKGSPQIIGTQYGFGFPSSNSGNERS